MPTKNVVSMSKADFERHVEQRLAALSTKGVETPLNVRGRDEPTNAPAVAGRREPKYSRDEAKQILEFFRGVTENDGSRVRAANVALTRDPQSVGVAADGGYGVPEQFVSEVLIDLPRVTPFADPSIVRIVPMASETMRWTKVVSRPADPEHVPEGTTYSKTKMTIAPMTLVAKKIGEIIPLTEEIMGSNQIGMVAVIAELVADAFAFKYNALVTNGIGGATEPEGITTNGDVTGVPLDTTDDETFADSLVDLFYALPSQYRSDPNVVFMGTDAMVARIRKIKDDNKRFQWTDGFASTPASLFGKRVFENPELDAGQVLFGNFKRGYIIGKKEGMTVDRNSSGTDWEKDIVNFKFRERWDGRVHDVNAFVIGTEA